MVLFKFFDLICHLNFTLRSYFEKASFAKYWVKRLRHQRKYDFSKQQRKIKEAMHGFVARQMAFRMA
jgi:hypothetical protein